MDKKIVKEALTLTLITLVAGLLLGIVFMVTEKPIETANYNKQQDAYRTVFADAASFEDLADFDSATASEAYSDRSYAADDTIEGCVQALDADGNLLGYVVTVTSSKGYGGDITFSVGIQNDGTINGIAFTTLSETAGLGMKAKEDGDGSFKSQFEGITGDSHEVSKDGGDITAISGATITSRAVTHGVDAAVCYFETLGGGANE